MESSLTNRSRNPRAYITALLLTAGAAVLLALVPAVRAAPANDIAADFGWTPGAPTPGQVITFTASATPPAGVSVKGYDWDFNGDGTYDKSGEVATWSFPTAGPYTVALRVRGNGNHRGLESHVVTVAPAGGGGLRPPVASFTYAQSAPVASQPVLFTSTSTDLDGSLSEQVWDLNGDGNYDNGGGITALRTFPAPGEYVVGLRVTDDDGLVSFDSRTVSVLPAPGDPVTTQKAGLRLLSPFPVVRIAGRIRASGTHVRLLRVDGPKGAEVSVRCSGSGCPFRKQVRAISSTPNTVSAKTLRVRRLERFLPAGVRVRVYVTKTGAIGKYTRFRFRAGKAPVRVDRCAMPGTRMPIQCPAG